MVLYIQYATCEGLGATVLCIEPSVADPERVQLRQNYFIFMENFQKNLKKLINNQEKLTN